MQTTPETPLRAHSPEELIAFFDTETTDMVLFKERSSDPRQPHMVEVAGLLYTTKGEKVLHLHAHVRPDGWTSAPEALAVHGLTDAYLTQYGIPERNALDGLLLLLEQAHLRVAHNLNFDDRVLRAAVARYHGEDAAEAFKVSPQQGACTALLAKPVCKLPPTEKMKASNFKNQHKTPTLAEAFAHLTGGKTFDGAHSAMADAQACARVYFMLQGVRMAEFPDDLPGAEGWPADEARMDVIGQNGNDGAAYAHLPLGQAECEAAQLNLINDKG